jgi:hypothetical protein
MKEEFNRKTETIKDRAIYVYLPSLEMVQDWKGRAEKSGVSISKFVIERVEDSLRSEEGEDVYVSRAELVKKLRDSEDELKKARNENRLLRKLAERARYGFSIFCNLDGTVVNLLFCVADGFR